MADCFVFIDKLFEGFDIFGFKSDGVVWLEGLEDGGNTVGDVAIGGFHFGGEVEVVDKAVDDGFEERGGGIHVVLGAGFAEEDAVDEDFEGELGFVGNLWNW